jgi:hypothetical protein
MIRHTLASVAVVFLVVVGLSLAPPAFAAQTTIFSQNFDSMTLGTNFWEPSGGGAGTGWCIEQHAFTHTPPSGWTNDRTQIPGLDDPAEGVPEWEGWSFTKKDWWAGVAGDQGRSEFTLGQGTVAVADPDEWDDLGNPEALGPYNAFLTTPSFSMVGAAAASGTLIFDSSFVPEGSQLGTVEIAYDSGAWQPLMYFFDTDAKNEHVVQPLSNSGGNTSAALRFSMTDAANNWWWAIDNIEVTTSAGTAFSENFETSVTLGPGEYEPSGYAGAPVTMENAFTPTPPANWSVDNSRMPTGGVPEWRGWTFVSPELWVVAAEDQGRSGFTKGQTVIAVADSDEFDDFTSGEGNYDTSLDTPEISLANVTAGTVSVTFDSAWQDEDNQTATITVSYDGGTPVEILRWESVAESAYFHDDNTNETTTLNLANPEGAEKMVLTFAYFNSRNNWFWAIDNLVIAGDVARILGDANGDTHVDDVDASILGAHWMLGEGVTWADGDFNEDGVVNDKDAAILAANWTGSAPENSVPEPATWVLILFGLAALAVRRRFR